MIGTSVMEELNSCKSSFLKFILMLAGDTPVLRVITQMVPNKLVCLKIGERFFFYYINFYFYFYQKITTQMIKSKTYKNFLNNKHRMKYLKVKFKANK